MNKNLSKIVKNIKKLASSSLDGKSKQSAIKYLYNIIGNTTNGFFNDEYWRPVHKVFKLFKDNNVDYGITSADYEKDKNGNPNRKVWKLEIPFMTNKEKAGIIYGTITAAGAGFMKDPLEKYDVTVVLG